MKYAAIMADPCWPYAKPMAIVGNGGRGKSNIENIIQVNVEAHYNTMSVDDIKNLPVQSLAEKNSLLFLWTTNAFMAEAYEVAKAWNFIPKTILTYGKIKEDGTPSMKSGWWFRGATEHIVFATRGKPKRKNIAMPTLYLHPRTAHSVKPDVFYELVEKVSDGPYLELFARRKRPGWHAWGNEIVSDIDIESINSK